MVTFPSVEAMIIVLPVEDGPNSFDRSTRIVSTVPSTVISTFFMMICVLLFAYCPATGGAVTSVRFQVAKISTVYWL